MRDKLNNKGFTLIELLAVLVILTAIMGIAIPNISSSLERNKAKQDKAKQKLFISAAELYVSNYKNEIYNKGFNECYISLDQLVKEDFLSEESRYDSNGKEIPGVVVFNKNSSAYRFEPSYSGSNCING